MKCAICKRPLDEPDDPFSRDCGGDCLGCMANIADDPDCIIAYHKLLAEGKVDHVKYSTSKSGE